MRYLFISDLHLEPGRPDITRAFLHCLENQARQVDEVYILGDFFEIWLGDDDPNPFADEIAMAMAQLAATGVKIYLMHGNRDFMIRRAFCRKARCKLLGEPRPVKLNGERVLLMHGDSLCIDDLGYMRVRRLLRNRLSMLVLPLLPLSTRRKVGRKLRSESQVQTQQKSSEITDVNQAEVVRVMQRYKVRTLIHGHTHRPAVHDLMIDGEPARRIVLGDWDKQGWALLVDETGYHLEPFPLG